MPPRKKKDKGPTFPTAVNGAEWFRTTLALKCGDQDVAYFSRATYGGLTDDEWRAVAEAVLRALNVSVKPESGFR